MSDSFGIDPTQDTYLISPAETGDGGKLLIKAPKSLALVVFVASKAALETHNNTLIGEPTICIAAFRVDKPG